MGSSALTHLEEKFSVPNLRLILLVIYQAVDVVGLLLRAVVDRQQRTVDLTRQLRFERVRRRPGERACAERAADERSQYFLSGIHGCDFPL